MQKEMVFCLKEMAISLINCLVWGTNNTSEPKPNSF